MQPNPKLTKPLPSLWQIHERKGFALIATLMLMVLIAIIALGLLTLSSVAIRSTSLLDEQRQAQANARMALMMAISRLQQEVGPDARITAPHDVGDQTGGMPNWVAVYDSWEIPEAGQVLAPGSRTPAFRRWLVSGASGNDGAATGDMATMVGSGTLGSAPDPGDEVTAPIIEVDNGKKKGRIAWWVSDESTKAKINAGSNALLAANPNPLLDTQSPPYVGHKAIPELADFDWTDGERAITISTSQIDLASDLEPAVIGGAFHDITVHGAGVLADVRKSHLKRDLSSLLSRDISELEDKPLYLADGRMNEFEISEDGVLANAPFVSSSGSGANRWGINLEELHLFHNIHREVDWSTGSPRLVNKSTKEEIAQDRFYIYRMPSLEAVHMILSFRAVPDEAPETYKMQGMLDGALAFSNPNDIPIVWSSGTNLIMDLQGFPYYVKWDIRKADGSVRHNHSTQTMNTFFFKCSIDDGFELEAGEAGVFGNSLADTSARQCDLTRGFTPRGGVAINDDDWRNTSSTSIPGLRADGLKSDDKIDFKMLKPGDASLGNAGSGWVQCVLRVSSGGGRWNFGQAKLDGGNNSRLTTPEMNEYMLQGIEPQQAIDASVFIDQPMPVMMMTFMPNVERSRNIEPPNAFASRPFQMTEPAVVDRVINTQNPETDMHEAQWLVITDPMNYEFGNDRTLAAGDGGRNLYHGGAREVGLGGSFNVVKRRIPLTAPLSLGAFENAIACGFIQRFKNRGGIPSGDALTGNGAASPPTAKAIGNSWATPFLPPAQVFDGETDPSWMVNNALWDQWFLSSIVDGRNNGSSPWMDDARSPREQFSDLADGNGALRNTRYIFHPHKSKDQAIEELFNGEELKPSAVNSLSKYLLVDGAFNVNSTSESAWKAFLTSVRDHELLLEDGSKTKFDHPFGTLGYAVNTDTSGTRGDWAGIRSLDDSEIDALVSAVVAEVKSRGPFLCVADFVNRRPNSDQADHRVIGALQAAIDKSGLNNRFTQNGRELTSADIDVLDGASIPDDEPVSARAIGSAGYLSQAALLTSIGSQITVRGDTFTIRAYGDYRNDSNEIIAKAWCEAVVQRTPEYVDVTDDPEAYDGWPTSSDTLTSANSKFGRKFEIVSFRWLSASEV